MCCVVRDLSRKLGSGVDGFVHQAASWNTSLSPRTHSAYHAHTYIAPLAPSPLPPLPRFGVCRRYRAVVQSSLSRARSGETVRRLLHLSEKKETRRRVGDHSSLIAGPRRSGFFFLSRRGRILPVSVRLGRIEGGICSSFVLELALHALGIRHRKGSGKSCLFRLTRYPADCSAG